MKNVNFPSNWYYVMIDNDDVVTSIVSDTSLTIDWLEQNKNWNLQKKKPNKQKTANTTMNEWT